MTLPLKNSPRLLSAYDLAWTSPSTDSKDSMPLVGGVLGLNVWVEDGDLLFLIGGPNVLDENGMQVKLGRIRLNLAQGISETNFRQELKLTRSEIVVSGQTRAGDSFSITLWCAVDKPVIHVEIAAAEPVVVTAAYEAWSDYEAGYVDGGLQWVRRLAETNARRERDMRAQGMAEFADIIPDPLSRLTMGGRLSAPGMEPVGIGADSWHGLDLKIITLRTSTPVKVLDICLTLRMEQDESIRAWETKLAESVAADRTTSAADRATALAWWGAFWDRSHIVIHPGGDESDPAWCLARNYQLFRYQLAANRNGRAMTLFNGGVLACEENPDVRMWEGCQFMAQNQRLVYWPMLRSGDFDLLKVALDFYRDRTAMSRAHAQKFWGVDGVAWPEPFSIFGLDSIGTNEEGRSSPRHLNYHYTSGIEFALMMLEYGRYTGGDISAYLPAVEGIISYYDRFYQDSLEKRTGQRLDSRGCIVIYPSDACEPYHGCTNNTDVLAGLWALSSGLLDLPDGLISAEKRADLREFQKRIPPIPIREVGGHKMIAAAESHEWVFYNGNMDFPDMYVLFPFNYFSLGRPDGRSEEGIRLASNTWDHGSLRPHVQRQAHCWYQGVINLARLGRTADAKRYIEKKLLAPSLRFPAFWTNYGFCHAPDTDHGGVGMIGLQEMLMQCDGRRILLGAAWPAQWNCDFKLVAPYGTTVEGRVADGRVIVDKVTPESRRADIEIFPLKAVPDEPISEPESLGDTSTRIEANLGSAESISRIVIEETDYSGRVTDFVVEMLTADDTWIPITNGDFIGARKEIILSPPVMGSRFRLCILAAEGDAAAIKDFQLHAK
jgi:hypothetical protein